MAIPIIDLFAGPGGLGEGFAALRGRNGEPAFRIGVSVEKDPVAHKTLTLRAVFRQLKGTPSVRHYYQYIKQEISLEEFKAQPEVAAAFEHASKEALCIELGKAAPAELDKAIRAALGDEQNWVLIGGPPCQAYSVAGRARRVKDVNFHADEKHFLYKEYLRIIQEHKPAVFVMENVKGLLSSTHDGDPMFDRILSDLSSPGGDNEYEIRSFVKRNKVGTELDPSDYVIEAEKYGIPQRRHRVILFGVRKDLALVKHDLLTLKPTKTTVRHAISDLPRLRSKLSKGDTLEKWREAVAKGPDYIRGWGTTGEDAMIEKAADYASRAARLTSCGDSFFKYTKARPKAGHLKRWVIDKNLGGYCQHVARSHMDSDLARYLFASCYAKVNNYSPRLHVFPPQLLPAHENVKDVNKDTTPFKDRFRVQCANEPSTTVVAHIAKDGHYYIHYDPTQCRSLTVREAARLQTFPDNYFFMGTRTEQYTQIGNAVPPLLANLLAKVVRKVIYEASGITSIERVRTQSSKTRRDLAHHS